MSIILSETWLRLFLNVITIDTIVYQVEFMTSYWLKTYLVRAEILKNLFFFARLSCLTASSSRRLGFLASGVFINSKKKSFVIKFKIYLMVLIWIYFLFLDCQRWSLFRCNRRFPDQQLFEINNFKRHANLYLEKLLRSSGVFALPINIKMTTRRNHRN